MFRSVFFFYSKMLASENIQDVLQKSGIKIRDFCMAMQVIHKVLGCYAEVRIKLLDGIKRTKNKSNKT